MAITKQEVQEVGFEHSLRGYDVEQVDVFLERVADEVGAMNEHIEELEEKLKSTAEELESAREQLAAVSAQEQADPHELEQATLREQEAQAELDVANDRASAESKRAEEAEAKIAELTEQLEEKNRLDNVIAEAFIAAQKSAEQLREDARVEADRIYQESEAKAREFIRESLAKKAAVDSEVKTLRAAAQKFRTEYLDMLDHFTALAKQEFQNLPDLTVSDEEISAELPDIHSMPGVEVQSASVELEEDDLPRLTTDQIPKIDVPPIISTSGE